VTDRFSSRYSRLERDELQTTPDQDPQFVSVDRFAEKVISTRTHGPQSRVAFILPGGDDHLDGGIDIENGGKRGQAFLRRIRPGRQAEVKKHDGGTPRLDLKQCGSPVRCLNHRGLRSQRPAELGTNPIVVIHHQHQRPLDRGIERRCRVQRVAGLGRRNLPGGGITRFKRGRRLTWFTLKRS
jgi:hypothetical protein